MQFFLIFMVAYVIGSLPSGYWFTRFFFSIDITKHGSGNIGATNVARIIGKPFFMLIFLFDAGKAYGTLYAAQAFFGSQPDTCLLLSGALLIGNAY